MFMLTTLTGDTPTNQPLCRQECATAVSADETSTGVMDSGCAMGKKDHVISHMTLVTLRM